MLPNDLSDIAEDFIADMYSSSDKEGNTKVDRMDEGKRRFPIAFFHLHRPLPTRQLRDPTEELSPWKHRQHPEKKAAET